VTGDQCYLLECLTLLVWCFVDCLGLGPAPMSKFARVCMAVKVNPTRLATDSLSVYTNTGSRAVYANTDGSTVYANTGSRAVYAYRGGLPA